MKKLTYSLIAGLALAASSFAGQEIVSGKDKNPVPVTTCFNDREFQLDLFGAYVDGNAGSHAGPYRDHGWGGGVGLNYFFTRNIGVGAEGVWYDAKENDAKPGEHFGDKAFHNINGSLIFRLPIDHLCLAPYAFVGGGAVLDGAQWAQGFFGFGAEYRVVPNKVGVFADARWNFYGDRYGNGDQNNFGFRAGVRLVF